MSFSGLGNHAMTNGFRNHAVCVFAPREQVRPPVGGSVPAGVRLARRRPDASDGSDAFLPRLPGARRAVVEIAVERVRTCQTRQPVVHRVWRTRWIGCPESRSHPVGSQAGRLIEALAERRYSRGRDRACRLAIWDRLPCQTFGNNCGEWRGA